MGYNMKPCTIGVIRSLVVEADLKLSSGSRTRRRQRCQRWGTFGIVHTSTIFAALSLSRPFLKILERRDIDKLHDHECGPKVAWRLVRHRLEEAFILRQMRVSM